MASIARWRLDAWVTAEEGAWLPRLDLRRWHFLQSSRSGASGAGVSRAVFASKHISRWHEMNSTSRGMALRE